MNIIISNSVTTVGYGEKASRSALGRIIGMFWIMVDLFLIANFSATMETVKEAYEKPAEGSVDSFVYDGPFYSIMHQEKGRELSK